MGTQSCYILLGDQCDTCNYISHAFTLLNFPLKQIAFSTDISSLINSRQNIAVIICDNILHYPISQVITQLYETNNLICFKNSPVARQFFDNDVCFLPIPFTFEQLKETLSCSKRCQHQKKSKDETNHPMLAHLAGESEPMRRIKKLILQVAHCDSTVLILGESGTGKDVIANCIHHLSNRAGQPFVPVNCGAIPAELMESELFGHEKGAFTGASNRRQGRFEIAQHGTLFLDEIGDMPLPMQVKLLRVIQERTIERIGGNASIPVDVRVISATNKNLEELIKTNRFREDLFYRLNVFPIHVPNLRDRVEDIPLLIEYHLNKIQQRLSQRVAFTERAIQILSEYEWTGNIRELANFLERMVIMHPNCVLDENDLAPIYKKSHSFVTLPAPSLETPVNIKEYIAKIEKQMIKTALERSNGVVHLAANYLSLGRTTLIEKMKKYNMLAR